ncbi:DNA-damage-inducible protein J [Planctomycetales bacterium]|nr:DNA-damage-inducible protein J [Planctomycetales bacterium]
MSETIPVTLNIDKTLKERAEVMFDDFGMTLTTAVNVFLRQSLRRGKIPFEIGDPFYDEQNQRVLRLAVEYVKAGKITPHELIEV